MIMNDFRKEKDLSRMFLLNINKVGLVTEEPHEAILKKVNKRKKTTDLEEMLSEL